ncbi:hypothetical protein ACH4SP_30275 [Streptomyces sp. NPDC021093]|uniref:hypothetical protein n=1 Tax=Streptomyces sp. NPDC021093 TaxID=3365112 RepID=UPI00379445DB
MSDALLSHAVAAAKRARRTAGRVRRRVERINTVPALGARVVPRPVLRPVHLSVLSGRTLNLALPCPHPATPPVRARLLLEHRGRSQSVPLDLERHPEGLLLTGTASLRHARHDDPAAPGPQLTDGVWRLTVITTDATGHESRYSVADPASRSVEGPTLPHPQSATTGAGFRPVRSVDGHAMIKVTGPREQAELLGFDLRWDRITVHGRLLAGSAPQQEFTAEAVRRGGSGQSVRIAPRWEGDRFTFDIPLDAMTRGSKSQRMWDLQLRRGRTRIRIARRLTDVRHPKKVFRTPFRTIATEEGALLRVHAHLAASGNLAVSCAPIAPQATPTTAAAAPRTTPTATTAPTAITTEETA